MASNDEYQHQNQEEYWKKEIEKCKESPYYFFTTYLRIDNRKVETFLTEQEFNEIINSYVKHNKQKF